jgi:hypothetical protein
MFTAKQQEVLDYIAWAGEVRGVYALAKALGRPYNRVLDNIRALEAAGRIEVSAGKWGGRRVTLLRAATEATDRQPSLSYNRIWSAPATGASDTALIASVIAKPTFDDVLQCCLHYGVNRVREIYLAMLARNELSAIGARSVGRMLANVEIGFARAA